MKNNILRAFRLFDVIKLLDKSLDDVRYLHHTHHYIRPLAVSPLYHSERVPTPWGFFISGSMNTDSSVGYL